MTTEESNRFIDCVSYEDCTIRLYGRIYWCNGLARYPDGKYHILVYELDKDDIYKWLRDILDYSSDSRDDCMKHFVEDKCWDGKSFWEVAPDMEWIDL